MAGGQEAGLRGNLPDPAFQVGGERSLRLREVAGNEDFAELLSYFRE